jgi:hypothetical protein
MITSLFRKSTPLNYSLVFLLVLFFFFTYEFHVAETTKIPLSLLSKIGFLCLVLATLFTANFITVKNGLSKDSAYPIVFTLFFLLFSPSIFNNINLLIANLFVLLAIRRLLSLQTLKFTKEKIFDASLWVFVASLFHFWAILFIILIFLSIIINAARDYRNWFLPFIAFFGVLALYLMFSLLMGKSMSAKYFDEITTNFNLQYFVNNYQNIAFSMYAAIALFFFVTLVFSLSNRPLILHSAYIKTIFSFLIGIGVFLISPSKSNDLLIFTFVPLSIMATGHIEISRSKLKQELVLLIFIGCSCFAFFSQL